MQEVHELLKLKEKSINKSGDGGYDKSNALLMSFVNLSVLHYPLTNEYCTTYYYNISHRFSITHRRNIIKKYMPGNTSRRIYEKIIQFHILSHFSLRFTTLL